MTTPPFDPPTERDIAIVSAQLGRPARNVIGISARCACGAPTVVSTAPRLADGTPFPTLYYLCHPAATAAVSTLEATGVMPQLAALLEDGLADEYLAAHNAYLADRTGIAEVPEIDGISAGGMPTRVKCLHALVGHTLAAGPGVNPIGDRALALAAWSPDVCQCVDYFAGSEAPADAAPSAAVPTTAAPTTATESAAPATTSTGGGVPA